MSGSQYSLFPRSDSQLPPTRYQISRERNRLVLVNETIGHEPRPLYKEVTRGRGVVKGHRQERSDILPLRRFEDLRSTSANSEDPTPAPRSTVKRSLTAHEIHFSSKDDPKTDPGEILQPTLYNPTLQPVSYETPRRTRVTDPLQRLGPRIMARKNSREEVPLTTRKGSRDETPPSTRTNSRDEIPTRSIRKNSHEDTSEPPKPAPRLPLTPVPEIRDEPIMERGRPVSRDSNNAFPSVLNPRSKSTAPAYILPQSRYSPSKARSLSLNRPPLPPPPPQPQPQLQPQPTPSTSEHARKDSLDPTNSRTDWPLRVVLALREIDKSCLRLFDDCETLQSERQTLHAEMAAVIANAGFCGAHLSILKQQQRDLVELDARIDACVRAIVERQRRKTGLVDGLPEVREMDRADGVDDKMAASSPWGPRKDSLKGLAQEDGLLSPELPSRKQQRSTVGYEAIMDFLDEFD